MGGWQAGRPTCKRRAGNDTKCHPLKGSNFHSLLIWSVFVYNIGNISDDLLRKFGMLDSTVSHVIVHGTLKIDGTLEVNEPINLPPGDVQITVQAVTKPSPSNENVWEVLDRIWAAQRERNFVPRTREEIDNEIKIMRDEAEGEMQAVENITF
jgi:hypothetical protein